jgi:hypothetical protein
VVDSSSDLVGDVLITVSNAGALLELSNSSGGSVTIDDGAGATAPPSSSSASSNPSLRLNSGA